MKKKKKGGIGTQVLRGFAAACFGILVGAAEDNKRINPPLSQEEKPKPLVKTLSHEETKRKESPLERTIDEVIQNSKTQKPMQSQIYAESQKRQVSYESTLVNDLIRYEGGMRNWAYDDANGKRLAPGKLPQGNRTIGVGFNLERPGASETIEALGINFEKVYQGRQSLNEEQIRKLLSEDVKTARKFARAYLGNETFEGIDPAAQDIVTNMAYNIGFGSLCLYQDLKKSLERKDYAKASEDMMYKDASRKDIDGNDKEDYSGWYKDTGRRAEELVEKMKSLANKK